MMGGPVPSPARKTVTLSVTVTAPGWLRKPELRKEVRSLLTEGRVAGTARPFRIGDDPADYVKPGDLRIRRVR